MQFYNDMLSSSAKYDFYYFTPNRIWDASGYYVTVIGDPVITAELNTYQMADVSIQWVSKTNPLPYEFDTDTLLEGLYYIVELAASQPFNNNEWCVATGSGPVTVTFEATLNHPCTSPEINWSIVQLDGSDPIGDISLTVADGDVDFNPSTAGVYLFKVVAQTPTGCVFGEYTVTLTVGSC